MIRIGMAGLAAALAASVAAAQDAAPPGCRWQGGVLACKDGHGHWRRSGDGEIVGTYPMGRPKPKPAAKAAQTGAPAAPQRQAAAQPLPPAPTPPAPPPPAPPVAPPAPARTAATAPAPKPASPAKARPPAPPPASSKKSWWDLWLDDIRSDFQALGKLVGLGR
jgi:outer membrane biosynthesis protein TonB